MYITLEDLKSRIHPDLLRRALDFNDDGFLSPEEVSSVLSDATSWINMHLSPIYDLPAPPYPAELIALTCDYAWGLLSNRHPDLMLGKDRLRNAEIRMDQVRRGTLWIGLGTPAHRTVHINENTTLDESFIRCGIRGL